MTFRRPPGGIPTNWTTVNQRDYDRLREIEALARKVVEAGPFYSGIDDDFCAVCSAYFPRGEDHKPDCAYILLSDLLEGTKTDTAPSPKEPQRDEPFQLGDALRKEGDTYPPMKFVDQFGTLDLTTAVHIIEYVQPIDESGDPRGELQVNLAVILDAAQGLLAFPELPPGRYSLEYKIDWENGEVETFPSAKPTYVRVLNRLRAKIRDWQRGGEQDG